MRYRVGAGICLLVAACAAVASAQESVDRLERNLQQMQRQTQAQVDRGLPPDQRAFIDYGGYLTLGYLSFDDAAHDNHALRQYELVGYGHMNFDGVHELYFRGRSDYYNYNPGDDPERTGDHLTGRVEEGWYRFDLQRYAAAQGRQIGGDVSVKAGRQFVAWGNGLTLDQYVDGVTAEARADRVALDVLAGVTVKETVDFDTSRPDFFDNTHRGFFGGRLTLALGRHNPYAYFLYQRDYNRAEPLEAHVIPTRYRYDSYYAGVGSDGALSDHLAYAAEFCFEGGEGLSNSYNPANTQPVRQTTDRIEAYAADLRVDYLPNDAHRSRFVAEGVLASGDTDRVFSSATFGGNKPGTVDHAFNSLGVLYTGLAFNAPVSNLLVLRLGASTYPLPQTRLLRGLQVGADVFVYGKAERAAPIDEPTKDGRYLGVEPDASVNWQVLDDLTFLLRYGVFVPGAAIPSGDQDHVRQFLYAGVTYAF